ncbi:uncharacterized protein LOC142411215 [Mycteria americana]|uniref:uncharacterized protein LOC142411215 n=1 Tax=Mycteria americana TaxID=33587 RepID=UPI003F585675
MVPSWCPCTPGSCCCFLAACSLLGEWGCPRCRGAQADSCPRLHGATSPWELLSWWWRRKQGCSCPHLQRGDTAPGRQVPAGEDLPSVGRGALPACLWCCGGPAKESACLAGSCPGWGSLRPSAERSCPGSPQQVTALSAGWPACCSRRSTGCRWHAVSQPCLAQEGTSQHCWKRCRMPPGWYLLRGRAGLQDPPAGAAWGSSQAGSEPQGRGASGAQPAAWGSLRRGTAGGLSCRQGAAGAGQEAGRLPARSCWLESGRSKQPDLSSSAAAAGRGGGLHKGPGIERQEVIRVCGARLGGSNK